MTISAGDRIPEISLTTMTNEGPTPVSFTDLFAGKRVALFAVPGAFTPTCSQEHLPGFVNQAEQLTDKGIDTVACISVNDVFVTSGRDGIFPPGYVVGEVSSVSEESADTLKEVTLDSVLDLENLDRVFVITDIQR